MTSVKVLHTMYLDDHDHGLHCNIIVLEQDLADSR